MFERPLTQAQLYVINQAHANSIHIANSLGAPNKALTLVTEEYNHWATRMKGYLKGNDKEIWRSIEQGPHVPTLTQREATDVEAALEAQPILTLTHDDILKILSPKLSRSSLDIDYVIDQECGILMNDQIRNANMMI